MTRRQLLSSAATVVAAADWLLGAGEGDPADETFWLRVREQFPIDPNVIQLNNAAIGSSPRQVLEATRRYGEALVSQPSHAYYDEQEDYVERSRTLLADFFGCDTEEIAILRNASEGLANVIFGLEMKPGDEVLTTTQDYPAVLDCLAQRAAREGVVIKKQRLPVPAASSEQIVAGLADQFTARTKLLVISHMTYATGQIFPVKQLCDLARARNVLTLVDGAQSFGHLPFRRDDLGCDFFAASLHKFFCAPLGTGFLYLRRERIGQVWPLFAASSRLSASVRKFDGLGPGTMPIQLRNGIAEAIYFHRMLPVEKKSARLNYLRRRWTEALGKVEGVNILTPEALSCGTATFVPGRCDPSRFVDAMRRNYQIHVRVRSLSGEFAGVRVSPNVFTTSAEIDRFVSASRTLLARGDKL